MLPWTAANKKRKIDCFRGNRSVPGNENRQVFTYQTRVSVKVHPAYTSTIGAVNHAARFGISIHQGAAIASARRSSGLSERPAVRVARVPTRRGGHVTVPLPPWNRGRHVWSLWSKVSRQIRAALRAHVRLLPASAGSTPASVCVQTSCAT